MKFTILGKPVPLGRPRFRVLGKGPRAFAQAYTPPSSKKWMDLIRNVAAMEMRNHLWNPYSKPVHVHLEVTPQKLKSGKDAKRIGDLDNHLKAVLDALNGVAYKDDSQVRELSARMLPAAHPSGITIEVTDLA